MKTNADYVYYGGRGICICDEWLNDFQVFCDWALSSNYKDNLTIDRMNTDGDYSPDNCRWVSMADQNRNKRCNINLTKSGETRNLKEWSSLTGIAYTTLYGRYRHGWDANKILKKTNRQKHAPAILGRVFVSEIGG